MSSRQLLVTGASSGIGLAVVERLAAANHHVVAVSRRPCPVERPQVSWTACDLTSAPAIDSLQKSLKSTPLDGIVLCHGMGDFGAIEQFSTTRIEKLVQTNLVSVLNLLRWMVPKLKTHGNGNIVLIGSEAGLKGARQGSVYCATKFAIRGLAQALREECGASSVRVSLINPGMVNTPFFDPLGFKP